MSIVDTEDITIAKYPDEFDYQLESPDFIPKGVKELENRNFERINRHEQDRDCTFRGIIKKGPLHGNVTFEASSELHQKHTRDFTCSDVIFMEQAAGRHIDHCPHVGFMTAKACCNKDKK